VFELRSDAFGAFKRTIESKTSVFAQSASSISKSSGMSKFVGSYLDRSKELLLTSGVAADYIRNQEGRRLLKAAHHQSQLDLELEVPRIEQGVPSLAQKEL
jgi:hypothetical protein